jgi:hypothetical protein
MISQVSTARDPHGRTVSVVPVLAGVVGDNMEIQRWLHGKSNTCHICDRPKDQLGTPGFLPTDHLKCSHRIHSQLSVIAADCLNEDYTYKHGHKGRAKERCAALGLHPSALHPQMAPIIRIKHFNAHQQVIVMPLHCHIFLHSHAWTLVCATHIVPCFHRSVRLIPCIPFPWASLGT